MKEQERAGLNTAEGAAYVGLGETMFKRLLVSGDIASYRVGRRRIIRRSTLEQWMEAREAEAQRPPFPTSSQV